MTFEELKKLLSFSDSAGTEARWILSENLSDSDIYKIIDRQKKGEPLSKILGHRGFGGEILLWMKTYWIHGQIQKP